MDAFKIISNVLGAIGLGLIFITAIFKSKKTILSIQTSGHLVLGVSDAFVGNFTGLAQEVLCMIRDIGIITKKANNVFKIILILLIVGVGIAVNILVDNSNIYGFFAIFGNLLFTIDIFYNEKNIIQFKFISAFSSIMWMLLFIDYQVYTSAVLNGLSAIINISYGIYLCVLLKKGKVDSLGNKINIEENAQNNEINNE